MIQSRLTQAAFRDLIEEWDKYFPRRVRFVACGSTALALQGLCPFPEEVGLMVPEEPEYLTAERTLKKLGYRACTRTGWSRRDGRIYDLFRGNRANAVELLESPLRAGNSSPWAEFRRIQLGILNDYDLVSTLMFRGEAGDFEDCAALIRLRGGDFDLARLRSRLSKTAKSDPNPRRVTGNLQALLDRLAGVADVRG